MLKAEDRERGATALFLAGSMVLLLGVAAIVLDLGVGYNDRNQQQIAADNAVMAGALDKADFLGDASIVGSVMQFAQSNIRNLYSGPNDAAWVQLWRSCVDSGNTGWVPLREPAGWASIATATVSAPTGNETLDCVSQTSSLLRVRTPDQLTDTSFGKVLGVQYIRTNAAAIAKAELNSPVPPMVPFGISGAAGPGELCFGSSPSGTAELPCTGPSSGTFGTILSELFGDFLGTPNCGNPTSTNSIRINSAIGIDHLLDPWPNSGGTVVVGSAHPRDSFVLNSLTETNRDACDLVGGHAVPVDGIPLNTLRVDTGFPSNELQSGLVSDDTFFGKMSRLQRWGEVSNPFRTVVARRTGTGPLLWELDNRGPWYYLTTSAASFDPRCDKATYISSMPTVGPGSKVARFNQCISAYVSMGSTTELFDAGIANSPRFVWAPQYWFTLPNGLSWEPIYKFRMSFLGGTWFKGGSPADILVFYPDEDVNDSTGPELCLPSGGGKCHQLTLWQLSAWYLPDSSLPLSVRSGLPGPNRPRVASLWE